MNHDKKLQNEIFLVNKKLSHLMEMNSTWH